jgi:hypothetical protein
LNSNFKHIFKQFSYFSECLRKTKKKRTCCMNRRYVISMGNSLWREENILCLRNITSQWILFLLFPYVFVCKKQEHIPSLHFPDFLIYSNDSFTFTFPFSYFSFSLSHSLISLSLSLSSFFSLSFSLRQIMVMKCV